MQENPSKAATESKTPRRRARRRIARHRTHAPHAACQTPPGAPPARSVSPTVATILEHNAAFVASKGYERYQTDKYPEKKLAIVSCMDTRLTELLLAALGLKNGDAKIIKVAGAEVAHPFGSVMRSLLIAVCELGVEDVMIVAHTNCGAQHMSGEEMVHDMRRLGVSDERISLARHCGIDFDRWLAGFGDTEESVRRSGTVVRNHPRHAAARAHNRLRHGLGNGRARAGDVPVSPRHAGTEEGLARRRGHAEDVACEGRRRLRNDEPTTTRHAAAGATLNSPTTRGPCAR